MDAAGEFNFVEKPNAANSVLNSPHLFGKLRIATADVSGTDSPIFSHGLVDAIMNRIAGA